MLIMLMLMLRFGKMMQGSHGPICWMTKMISMLLLLLLMMMHGGCERMTLPVCR